MKIKTAELTGPALDWAVAKCEGFVQDGDPAWEQGYEPFDFCNDWAQGGPIIDREFISISPGEWDIDAIPVVRSMCAWSLQAEIHGDKPFYYGPTPLVAAMRCYVSSKLGETIDVPEELT